jgi:hypothetical protein
MSGATCNIGAPRLIQLLQHRLTVKNASGTMQRLWIGKQIEQKRAAIWRKPTDTQPIALSPMDNTVLEFPTAQEEDHAKRIGYVLRIQGYYDFVKDD